ncbi:MAG: glutamate racemase [Abditibacteriota bacterium]|nr:glutamate racemase [Abditibacteriota bacterium]
MIIGMYDSGIGGLTVAKEVINQIPTANIIYIADNFNVPYGDKEGCLIRSFSCEISKYLLSRDVDTICIACNMSTAVSLETIKEMYPNKKIYGTIEFGAKDALKYTDKIGVLATVGTVKSGAYTQFIKNLNPNAVVKEEPAPEFVPLVEKGMCNSVEADRSVKEHIENIIKKCDIGALILGCTHYPYLTDLIKKYLPKSVEIINPAVSMARFLREENIYNNNSLSFECYATKDIEQVSLVCENVLNLKVECKPLSWNKGILM